MNEPASNAIDWPQMLETHKPWLSKVLRCRVGDAHAVEDLLQNIALAVVQQSSPRSCNGKAAANKSRGGSVPADPEKVAPWLYRLAIRQSVNFHRRANRKSTAIPMEEIETPDQAPSVMEELLAHEKRNEFTTALTAMAAARREILTLKYSENWSYQQISDHLGIPVRSVEYRLLQARKELRKLLPE